MVHIKSNNWSVRTHSTESMQPVRLSLLHGEIVAEQVKAGWEVRGWQAMNPRAAEGEGGAVSEG